MVPEDVLAAHRLAPSAFDRLIAITEELARAAQAGDVARIRQLKNEKARLEADGQRQVDALLSATPANRHRGPARGEEANLGKRLKQLESEITRARTKREKFQEKLVSDPESEHTLASIEAADSLLRDCNEELKGVSERIDEIAAWRAEEERREAEAAKQREKAAARPKILARLTPEVRQAIAAHKKLTGSLSKITELLDELQDHATARKLFDEIAEGTDGAVRRDASGWHLDLTARRTR